MGRTFVITGGGTGLARAFARTLAEDGHRLVLTGRRLAKVQAVANNSETWGKSGIDSTPTLLINASKIEGNTWAELEAALQRAGAR